MNTYQWLKEAVRGAGDDCIEWPFYRMSQGYGQVRIGQKTRLATHVALELAGIDKTDECALHACDNPPCVNPKHLYWGDRTQNSRDMVARGRDAFRQPQKLSEDKVQAMFILRDHGWTQQRIANAFDVHQVQVSRILLGKDWAHVDRSAYTADASAIVRDLVGIA